MSATARGRAVAPTTGALLVAVGGMTLLVARTGFLGLVDAQRTLTACAVFVGVGAAARWVPVPDGRARLPAAVVLATGIVGVMLATIVTGAAPGLPIGTWTLPTALLAAIAEELLFRRLAYGALARRSEMLAVALTAVAFALIHLPLYGVSALPVDLGAGLLFSWQRWAGGSWTVPAATHAVANMLAVMR